MAPLTSQIYHKNEHSFDGFMGHKYNAMQRNAKHTYTYTCNTERYVYTIIRIEEIVPLPTYVW